MITFVNETNLLAKEKLFTEKGIHKFSGVCRVGGIKYTHP